LYEQTEEERRRSPRMKIKGTVVVLVAEHVVSGRVENLSLGGILVSTSGTGLEQLLGRTAAIELRLDGNDAEWLRCTGRVKRVGAGSLAVELDSVPRAFSQLIDDSSTAWHRNRRVLSVILVDATASRRAAIAEAFKTVGCWVIEVSTPLEMVVRLGESQFEPDLIVVADSVPEASSAELRQFIAREHPRAKLVTIGDELIEPDGIAHWLSSADPRGDLVARVRALLMRPVPR